jgi:psp operon transcriptional activator
MSPAVSEARFPVSTREALGQSETFLEFQERLSRVAPVNRPVLLIGERGTGKELAASRLHFLSRRWEGPLVALNCAALASSLIESELFGYERGAFTGAQERRKGRFESADNGTLFLDEIGNIPLEVQEKILRVVEYGTLERVGSAEPLEVDVRIIAATNADLGVLVKEGRFKQDLLDRLSFEVLHVPPLRERREDILFLAEHFAAAMALELGRDDIPQFGADAAEKLKAYPWPGNIRELKNTVERAVYRTDASVITEIEFNPLGTVVPDGDRHPAHAAAEGEGSAATLRDLAKRPIREAVAEVEIHLLKNALKRNRYHQKRAARSLGLSYHQFRGLYRKYKELLVN